MENKKLKTGIIIAGIGAAVTAAVIAFVHRSEKYIAVVMDLDEDDFYDEEDICDEEDDVRYCVCCGAEVRNTDNFCKVCGEVID